MSGPADGEDTADGRDTTNGGSRARARLEGIGPQAWEHPTDRAALSALRKIPGFDSLLRKVVGMFGERNVSMMFTAAAVRVGPDQYPSLHRSLERVCRILDTEVPPLYISQTPLANAGAFGMDRPFIVLDSSLIELLRPEEVEVVLGHEVGHIMSDHALYRTLLVLLLQSAGPALVPAPAIMPITLALQEWSRKAEISSDRAGLLAVQDLEAAVGTFAVMAGGVRGRRDELSTYAFLQQADEYRSAQGLSAYYRFMATLGQSHPFPVIRAAELRNWLDSGAYDAVIGGTYPRRTDPRPPVDDLVSAGKNFSEAAATVFEDTDRYVNDALTTFMKAAKRRLDAARD